MGEAAIQLLAREVLAGRVFRFGNVEGHVFGQLSLAPDGRIEGYQHPNERRWDVIDGNLVFYGESGAPLTVFNEIGRNQSVLEFHGEFLPRGPGRWHVLVEQPKSGRYELSHLTQHPNQDVSGPIQDDEALLLFGLIRVMCIRRVLEIGGLSGYSATNFARAVGPSGIVYTTRHRRSRQTTGRSRWTPGRSPPISSIDSRST